MRSFLIIDLFELISLKFVRKVWGKTEWPDRMLIYIHWRLNI